jgi:hypothetical protein
MRNITDPTTDPSPRRPVDRRMLAIVLAVAGAACLIVASFSKSWMGNPSFSGLVRDRDGNATAAEGRYLLLRGDIRFGPTGFERCAKPYRGFEVTETPAEVTCETTSTENFNELIAQMDPMNRDRYTSGAFAHAGWAAFGACLLSAAALLVSAGLALARKQMELPISPASVALLGLMAAMVAGCVFIATKPGPAGMLGVDLGFWAFGAGTVVGMLGAQMLAKQLRPPDPDLLADAMDPADFSMFPVGRREAPAAVPVPLAPVPPTQPVEALVDEAPGAGAPGAPAGEAPAGAKGPEESS